MAESNPYNAYCKKCEKHMGHEIIHGTLTEKKQPYGDGVTRVLTNIRLDTKCYACGTDSWTIDDSFIEEIGPSGFKRRIQFAD